MKSFAIIVLAIFCFSCSNGKKDRTVVDFTETVPKENNLVQDGSKVVYIAIASMTSPKETFTYYSDLINYISQKVGYPIYIKQKKTYEEVNILLENSEVDFAFICSGAYVNQYKKGITKLLVAPEIDHKSDYNAYIITRKESEVNLFKDFENKSFAFTDPLSNTGRLFPLKKIAELHKNEKDFFEKTIYTYGHDISIQMVNRGIIDGASVHGLIFNYISVHHPEQVANVKIIAKSEKFGIPPVVTPTSLNKESFEKYQNIFLNLHTDSLGKKILDNLMIDKFVLVHDTIYNTVFELKQFIDNEGSR
jgi:phosphonate transport system substrate-binding protein